MKNELGETQEERLRWLAALPDEEIDTSDIPEVLDWSHAVRLSELQSDRARLAKDRERA